MQTRVSFATSGASPGHRKSFRPGLFRGVVIPEITKRRSVLFLRGVFCPSGPSFLFVFSFCRHGTRLLCPYFLEGMHTNLLSLSRVTSLVARDNNKQNTFSSKPTAAAVIYTQIAPQNSSKKWRDVGPYRPPQGETCVKYNSCLVWVVHHDN